MTNYALKIAVLHGGSSSERGISLKSGQAVAQGLVNAGFTNVSLIDTKNVELNQLKKQGVELAFIALHGRGGEDGTVQGALECLDIPYTGSGVLGSALGLDKIRCKQIWQCLGYPTANFTVVEKSSFDSMRAEQILSSLGGKVMVKAANEGSSIGISSAANTEQLIDALHNAFNYDEQVLVEAWIDGLEYTVGFIGEQALPAVHMQSANEFYDYQAKYELNTTQYNCPSGLSASDEAALQALAIKAYKAVAVEGWGRVDFMRKNNGDWQLLEVNTSPGMTESSLVPKAAKVAGYSFSELVTEIVNLTMAAKG